MTRFAAFLDGKEPDVALLRTYLSTRGEWVAREFKLADRPSVFGLRVAVAAFANTEGGDVFLGVTDSGDPIGTPVDPSEIGRTLRQEGAPARDGFITNLVLVVRDPRRIVLENGRPVYWIDVAAQGLLAGVLKSDGTLGLYDRPGAESDEVKGFEAIDLVRRKTRARLLVALFSEFRRIVKSLPNHYVGPNQVRDDTIRPILLILESPEWQAFATPADRNLTNNAYLGNLLSFPADAALWEKLPYSQRVGEWSMRTLTALDQAVRALEGYLRGERIVPPS